MEAVVLTLRRPGAAFLVDCIIGTRRRQRGLQFAHVLQKPFLVQQVSALLDTGILSLFGYREYVRLKLIQTYHQRSMQLRTLVYIDFVV